MMFSLSYVKGSKSAERGANPLADMNPGGAGVAELVRARPSIPGDSNVCFDFF